MARILRRWRELTGGKRTRDPDRRTLIACSGGADSVLLVEALASVAGACVVAHITHDLRQPSETEQDRQLVDSLTQRLGLEIVHTTVSIATQAGNTEANAREARYSQLAMLATEHGCRFVATGHHADDQLETLLMHLLRGSGSRGMIGMHHVQQLHNTTIIRPMLDITRQEIESALHTLHQPWREDHTNADTAFLRNRIRRDLLPILREMGPRVAQHASEWSRDLASIQSLLDHQIDAIVDTADRMTPKNWSWQRAVLRAHPPVLLGNLPARYIESELGRSGLDKLTRRAIESWVRAVKSDSTEPTNHRIGPIVGSVRANHVVLMPASSSV